MVNENLIQHGTYQQMFDNEYFMLLNNSTYQSQLIVQCILDLKVPQRDRHDLLFRFGNFLLEVRQQSENYAQQLGWEKLFHLDSADTSPKCGDSLWPNLTKARKKIELTGELLRLCKLSWPPLMGLRCQCTHTKLFLVRCEYVILSTNQPEHRSYSTSGLSGCL